MGRNAACRRNGIAGFKRRSGFGLYAKSNYKYFAVDGVDALYRFEEGEEEARAKFMRSDHFKVFRVYTMCECLYKPIIYTMKLFAFLCKGNPEYQVALYLYIEASCKFTLVNKFSDT